MKFVLKFVLPALLASHYAAQAAQNILNDGVMGFSQANETFAKVTLYGPGRRPFQL